MYLIILTLALLLLSAFFSASETALFSIPREQIASLEGSEKMSNRYIFKLLRDGQRTLMVILIGNLAVNITVVGAINKLIESYVPNYGFWFTFISATGMILLFGEIIPKNIAVHHGSKISHLSAPILYNFKQVLKPVVFVMEKVNLALLSSFSRYLRQPSPFITMEELANELNESQENGVITEDEFKLLDKVLQSVNISVSSAVIHRSELIFVDKEASVSDAVKIMGERDAWFCVSGDSEKGKVEHFLFIEDLLHAPTSDAIAEHLIKSDYVTSTMKLSEVTLMMRRNNHRAVSVQDEYGDLHGVFTLNSGLRRILMTTDKSDENSEYVGVFKGLDQLTDIPQWIPLSLQNESQKYKTLNGLITGHLGRIPQAGERFAIDGWIFYIISSNKRIIDSVRIVKGNSNVS